MTMLSFALVLVAVATTETMRMATATAISNDPPTPSAAGSTTGRSTTATPTPSARLSSLRHRPSSPILSPRQRTRSEQILRGTLGGGCTSAIGRIAMIGGFAAPSLPPHYHFLSARRKTSNGNLLPVVGTSKFVRMSHGEGAENLRSRTLEPMEGREKPRRGPRIRRSNAIEGTGLRDRMTSTEGPIPDSPRRSPTLDRRNALLAGAVVVATVASRAGTAAAELGSGVDDGDHGGATTSSSSSSSSESLRSHASDEAGGEATMMASPLLSSPPPKDGITPTTPAAVAPPAEPVPAAKTVGVGVDPRYFVAGGSCASISHGLATPFDVVKTRIQSDPEEFRGLGLIDSARKISESSEGPMALLGGLGPTVIGYGVEGALKFGVYEALKPVAVSLLYGGGGAGESTWVPYLLASVAAGAAASVLLCPLEDARIKMVTDPEDYAGGGTLGAISKMISEDGPLAAFSGMPAMLSKQVPYTMTKQVSFEYFAGSLYGVAAAVAPSLSMVAEDLKWEVSVCAAFLASILACVASQPGDVLLTQTYKGVHEEEEEDGGSLGSSTNVPKEDGADGVGGIIGEGSSTGTAMATALSPAATAVKKEDEGGRDFATLASSIYESEGIGGFFAGLRPRFVHVASIITSQLVIYDLIKQLLGLPATGTH